MRLQSFFEQVSNRVYRTTGLMTRNRVRYTGLATKVTVDESQVNYLLARSIMDGSVITDEDGREYGADYVLASGFAAPVVNSMTAIMLSNPPQIKLKEEQPSLEEYDSTMRKWYKDNQSVIFDSVSASQAEGDSYLYVKDTFDAQVVQLLPEYVTKIVNPSDYTDVIGYEVKSARKQYNDKGEIVVSEYKTIYRKKFPYKIVIKLKNSGEPTDTIVEVDNKEVNIPIEKNELYLETLSTVDDFKDLFEDSGRFEERPLQIVPIHFKKKAQHVYGESVFRNLYIYFLNYNRLLDHIVRNVIFNLISLPYIKGVTDVDSFLKNNGVYDYEKKEYVLKLTPNKVLFGGDSFDMKMLTTPNTVEAAETAIKILFYLIVQASEVPEFFFGTAVSSSKASVKEQLPIVINKGKRYQTIYTQQMIELFKTVLYYKTKNGDVTVDYRNEFDFSWGVVSLDDQDSIIKLVETLEAMELVTDETKANILGLSKYVSDVKKEISDAKEESDNRSLSIDRQIEVDGTDADVEADAQVVIEDEQIN